MKTNRWTIQLRSAERIAVIAGLLLASSSSTPSQEYPATTPQVEASVSYSYVRANAANGGDGFNLNGGSGSAAYNFSDRFSAVADFGVYRFTGLPSGITSTMYTYMFGPRVTLRRNRPVEPFAQILLGGARVNASAGGVDAGENGFAMAVGGGVDMPFRRHFAVRLVQVEYLLTRFDRVDGTSATQNDARISAGLVFRFGSR